jgi:hypothetical protein
VISLLLLRCHLELQLEDDECPNSVDRLDQGLDVMNWRIVMAALGANKLAW